MAFLRRCGQGRVGQLNFHEGYIAWLLRGWVGIGKNSGDRQRQIDNVKATQLHMCTSPTLRRDKDTTCFDHGNEHAVAITLPSEGYGAPYPSPQACWILFPERLMADGR